MPTDSSDLDFGATIRAFAPGQTVFSRFRLERLLGRGGMGVVWLAHDAKLERNVALKFLPEAVALDPRAVDDLKRETRRSLDLTHPNIVRIYDFFEDDSAAAISLEYVDGGTLAKLAVDQPIGCYEPAQLNGWIHQLVDGLHYAHEKAHTVHRDLKPANLMVTSQGALKITDFGISATVTDSVTRVSRFASSGATPAYASPQQVMGERPSPLDDIYSLGATIFDLVTSRPPFHSGNLLAQVQSKPAPTMTQRREELGIHGGPIPEPWERTVAACLAKDPASRPQTVTAVLAGLEGRPVAVEIASKHARPTPAVVPPPVPTAVAAPAPAPAPAGNTPAAAPPAPPSLPPLSGDIPAADERRPTPDAATQTTSTFVHLFSGKGGRVPRLIALAACLAVIAGAAWLLLGRNRSAVPVVTTTYEPAAQAPARPAQSQQPQASVVPTDAPMDQAPAGKLSPGIPYTPLSDPPPPRADSLPKSTSAAPMATSPYVDSPPAPPPTDFSKDEIAVPSVGTVRIVSEPAGAAVTANGQEIGVTPLTLEAPIGRAEFVLKRAGFADLPIAADVVGGQVATITAPMQALTTSRQQPARRFAIPEIGITMVWLEPGEFSMGSRAAESDPDSDEHPLTRVRISRGFWLGQTEVTRLQWVALEGKSTVSNPNHPAARISWEEAADFCRRLTQHEQAAGRLPNGYVYRLPTEAEWEYACRAGSPGPHAGDIRQLAYIGQRGGAPRAVGLGQPNAWGLFDMHGNVAEWTSSWYGAYPGGEVADYPGATSGPARVFRGGAFDSTAQSARSAYRGYVRGSGGAANRGLRVALAPEFQPE